MLLVEPEGLIRGPQTPGALQIWWVEQCQLTIFRNGWNLIYKKIGDDWGMVRLWHCFTHIIFVIIYNLYNPLMFNRNPSVGIYNDYG